MKINDTIKLIKLKIREQSEYNVAIPKHNIKLNQNPIPVIDNRNYSILNNNFINANLSNSQDLLIFESNLSFEKSD